MAAPVWQSTGTYGQTSGGSPATSLTLSAPASIASGDLLEAHFTMDSATATITPPSGWSHADGSPLINTSGGNQQNIVMYKWATGSEPANYTWNFSVSCFAEGAIGRVTGAVGSGNPHDATNTATAGSGSTTTPGVSLTTTGADRLIVHAYTSINSGAWTPNSGYTTKVSGGFNTCGASVITQTSAGSTGTVQASKTPTDAKTAWLGAILPVASGPTPIAEADAGSSAEAVAVAATVPLAQGGSSAEVVAVAATVPLAEAGAGAQSIAVSATVPLADAGSAADALATVISIAPGDAASAAQSLAVAATVPLAEGGSAAEALSVVVTLALADAGAAADAIVAGHSSGLIGNAHGPLPIAVGAVAVHTVSIAGSIK